MKSPQASDKKAIERNLRKACKQSANIIFDSQRVKGAFDAEIEKCLRNLVKYIKSVKRLWFVNRERKIIDIK